MAMRRKSSHISNNIILGYIQFIECLLLTSLISNPYGNLDIKNVLLIRACKNGETPSGLKPNGFNE